MMHKIIILIVCVACLPAFSSNEHGLGTGSGQDFSVYFLKTDHPLSKFDGDSFPSIKDIILARNHENDFLGRDGNQRSTGILTESEYETSSEDKCRHNNGNCAHKCETIGNVAVCSCDEGFFLIDETDCYQNISSSVTLSGTSGKFLMNEKDHTWIIRAPKNHIIELEIIRGNEMPSYYEQYYSVYDSRTTKKQSLSRYDYNNNIHKFRSSGPYLTIITGDNWMYEDVFATYKTGLPYYVGSNVRVSPLLTGFRCYSVTYNGYLKVEYSGSYDPYNHHRRQQPSLSFTHHHGKWTTSVFRTRVRKENTKLDFSFSSQSQVLMLRECLDIEYPWKTSDPFVCYNGGTWNSTNMLCDCEFGFSGKHCENGLSTRCMHGGIWSKDGACMCPPGFVGPLCEEGCGANRYGENCAKVCSILSTGCQGAIFCGLNMCTCAPGFYGETCAASCSEGFYGASCQQDCGKCKNNSTCDRYTGECHSGCEPGYYPPFCQQTYKVLTEAPEILGIGYRHIKLRNFLLSESGRGQPKYYEVQYKVENDDSWSKLTPRKISNEEEIIIENLIPGHFYSVRIILIDKDGGSCDLNIPETTVMTKCIEPHHAVYSLTAKGISENELTVKWSYIFDRSADLCLVRDFELSLMSEGKRLIFSSLQKDGNKTLSGLLPNTNYIIQLIGITQAGTMIPSQEIMVHTLPVDPGKVVNVQLVPVESSRELKITWQPPRNSTGVKMKYQVSYTCLRMLACDSIDHPLSTQDVVVEATTALLEDLQPHAMYQIHIVAVTPDGFASEDYIINATTEESAPQVAPSVAENPILSVTNVSASVTWLPPRDCALLNGYLHGYSYKLVDNETGQVLKEHTVKENVQFVNFTSLKPNHCYDAHIAVVSSGGVDLLYQLVIPFCTSPTVPSPVLFLKVYKRSRKMVGLKWSRPLNMYGEIDSFVISYSEQGTDRTVKTTIKPQHCNAWNNFYCHTISHLSPSRKYSFMVQARNDKVNADGEPASIEAVTTEGASTAPVNLKVVNATESSVTLEWQLPENINGQLRSFILMTEQVDTKGASDECCDSIPLADYRVTSEEPFYIYEITGLSAASTYSVAIAAKTLTLGEEAHIIVHTQPPKNYFHTISLRP